MKYDFGGYVTKNNITCTDGRIIRHGAFDDCDGKRVPLVYQHVHDSIDNVLGHVDLDVRSDGVYGYASLNNTPSGKKAREVVRHSDVASLSIYANQLRQHGPDVVHGVIQEVSLVLAGANSGATIDNLSFAHGDGSVEAVDDEAIISMWSPVSLSHAMTEDEDEEKKMQTQQPEPAQQKPADESKQAKGDDRTVGEVFDSFTEDEKNAVYAVIAIALQEAGVDLSEEEAVGNAISHADDADADEELDVDVAKVFDSMSEEKFKVACYVIAKTLEDAGLSEADIKKLGERISSQQGTNQNEPAPADQADVAEHSGMTGGTMGRRNVFESARGSYPELTHSEVEAIFHDAQKSGNGSLKDAVLAHGITSVETLFPDAQAVSDQPALITRRMEWVQGVLNAVHKSPFSRVKGTAFNLTADEARARGYIKGNKKEEEQISALKRVTTPQTIYKLQKLDRDDILDITDFDVVAFLKNEMRTMLDEELARAILVGDGRSSGSNDKIKEENIRPVWRDDPVYTYHVNLDEQTLTTGKDKAKAFIEACIRARKYYKGSGTPTLYIGVDLLTEMRLLRDEFGYRLYKTDQELCDELRVAGIVEVEQFDGLKVDANEEIDGFGTAGKEIHFGGVIVNLADYNVGTDRGGEVTMFDDFDLNYNKQEYLLETRVSGALVQPAAALAIDFLATKG